MVFRGRSCGCSDEHLSKGVSAGTEGNKVETISWVDRHVLSWQYLAIYGLEGWKATSKMLSSNFFLWAVISWTHVLLSRFHSLRVANVGRRKKEGWQIVQTKCDFSDLKLPDAAIMAARYKVEAMLVNCQAGHTVQVRHHAREELPMRLFQKKKNLLSSNILSSWMFWVCCYLWTRAPVLLS